MPLHPVIADMLAQMAQAGRPALSAGRPDDARQMLRTTRAALGRGPEMDVRELRVPTRAGAIGARLYEPVPDPVGIVVYLHGGGWVLGELDDYDALARTLAARSRCSVLAPDYRLAPEHPFPAGLEDAEDAILWASGHRAELGVEGLPLVVAGDSAGGNLATVAAGTLGGRVRIAAQVLVYPATDSDPETPSYQAYGEGLPLTRQDMRWFLAHYAPASLHADPRISPLRRAGLEGSPPAVVITAEYDVLRDEGERYAERLRLAGTPVILRRVDGLPHGFLRLHNLVDAADAALSAIAADIAQTCSEAPIGEPPGQARGQ